MIGFPCACLSCGTELGLVTAGTTTGWETGVILECPSCRKRFQVRARISEVLKTPDDRREWKRQWIADRRARLSA